MSRRGYALVTGASSGIGVEIARELAGRGWPVILVARRQERLAALADRIGAEHGVDAKCFAHDLAQPGAGQALFDAVVEADLPVEILVNNAGFGVQGRFVEQEFEAIERMVRLNVLTLTELTHCFVRPMVDSGRGYVMQVASAAAFLPSPYVAAYAATKHYVKAFGEAIRFELRRTGVSVTTLYPGITRTEFNAVAAAKTPPLMNLSILSAEAVARAGVRAMLKRKRSVVPGLINKLNAFFSEVFHRGFITHAAGRLLEDANEH